MSEDNLKCSACAYVCRTVAELDNHYHKVHNKYGCSKCFKKFTRQWSLKRHVSESHVWTSGTFSKSQTATDFKCCICGKTYRRKWNFKRHFNTAHKAASSVPSPQLGVRARPSSRQAHSRNIVSPDSGADPNPNKELDAFVTSDDKGFPAPFLHECSQCVKVFASKQLLQLHFGEHHFDVKACPSIKPNESHESPRCNQVFTKIRNLKTHIQRQHADELAGLEAPAAALDPVEVVSSEAHESTSSSEHCLRADLKETKTFQCTECLKVFFKRKKLDQHFQQQHGLSSAEKSAEASTPDKKRASSHLEDSSSALSLYPVEVPPSQVHEAATSLTTDFKDTKKFQCSECLQVFFKRKKLDRHFQRQHTNRLLTAETPAEASTPEKKRTSYSPVEDYLAPSLDPGEVLPNQAHESAPSGDHCLTTDVKDIKNFKCSECLQVFFNRKKLDRHFQRQHADVLPSAEVSAKASTSQKERTSCSHVEDYLAPSLHPGEVLPNQAHESASSGDHCLTPKKLPLMQGPEVHCDDNNIEILRCSVCSLIFSKKRRLEKHYKKLHGEAFPAVQTSGKAVISDDSSCKESTNLVTHSEDCFMSPSKRPDSPADQKTKDFRCSACPQIFSKMKKLEKHYKRLHGEAFSRIQASGGAVLPDDTSCKQTSDSVTGRGGCSKPSSFKYPQSPDVVVKKRRPSSQLQQQLDDESPVGESASQELKLTANSENWTTASADSPAKRSEVSARYDVPGLASPAVSVDMFADELVKRECPECFRTFADEPTLRLHYLDRHNGVASGSTPQLIVDHLKDSDPASGTSPSSTAREDEEESRSKRPRYESPEGSELIPMVRGTVSGENQSSLIAALRSLGRSASCCETDPDGVSSSGLLVAEGGTRRGPRHELSKSLNLSPAAARRSKSSSISTSNTQASSPRNSHSAEL